MKKHFRKLISLLILVTVLIPSASFAQLKLSDDSSEESLKSVYLQSIGSPTSKSASGTLNEAVLWINDFIPVLLPITLSYSYTIRYTPTLEADNLTITTHEQTYFASIDKGAALPFSSVFTFGSAQIQKNGSNMRVFYEPSFNAIPSQHIIYSPSDIVRHRSCYQAVTLSYPSRILAGFQWYAQDATVPASMAPMLTISF